MFIHCHREGDVITNLAVHSGNRTTDEAYEEAKRLIAYWELDPKNLDEWYRGIKSGGPEGFNTFATYGDDREPAPGLAIRQSFDDAKPWFLDFEVSWCPRDSASWCPARPASPG